MPEISIRWRGQEDANRVFVLKASHSDNLKLNPLSILHLSPSAL